jgi:UDP-N-acetylglucosamine 1-carboxyvinyltransferase
MSSLVVNGGISLSGEISPSGNKNSVLPIICATLLTDDLVILENVPDITDVNKLLTFYKSIGSDITFDKKNKTLKIQHSNIHNFDPEQVPSAMRSSLLLFAPLLNRLGRLKVHTNTKGCALGVREIDPHVNVLSAFGYQVDVTAQLLTITGKKRPDAATYWFDYASVTATETFLMAAAIANGNSQLSNAASEPHVQDVGHFLNMMGAKIDGIGSNTLKICGVEKLQGGTFRIPDDHHEVATYLAMGAITNGQVKVLHTIQHHMALIDGAFSKLGVALEHGDGYTSVKGAKPYSVKQPITKNTFPKIEAAPWPYFPADLLPPFIALATACSGNTLFWNKVYEGGLSWIPELNKFGAFAHLSDPHKVIVIGGVPLNSATVESPYIIRAAIALLMMGLSIPGRSVIQKADPISRAHPHFVENLKSLGADVEWVD